MTDDRSYASKSLTRHLVRGVVGFGALVGSFALMPVLGWASLFLAPLGLLALRGCPTCWAIGLAQTLSMGRLRRTCVDGRCELTVAGRAGSASHGNRQPGDEPPTTRASPPVVSEARREATVR